MAKASQTASLLLLLLVLSIKFLSLSGQKENFTYNGFQSANLKFDGIATVLSNGLLQLTNMSSKQFGHAFYPFPLNFNNSSSTNQAWSFSTTFLFAIVPDKDNHTGHGIAFTIAPAPHIQGAVPAEYLGLFNDSSNGKSSNRIFAVELDTARSLEFGDIDNNHVGIDVNSLTSNQSASAAYYSAKDRKNISLYLSSGDPMQVWIDYDGIKKQINVTLAPLGIKKPKEPLISTFLDLSLVFQEQMYVGFSASNGILQSSHYILGWSFNRNGPAQGLDLSHLPSIPRRRKSSKRKHEQTIGLSLGMLMIILITVTGGLYLVRKKRYEEIREDWEQEYGPHRFSYKDLYRATKGFQDKELLGSGGFGKVYRGTLPTSKIQVAIKRVSHDSKQGIKEFIAEIACLGRLRHRNMVQLLGYCRRSGELLLVYDYMSNGSLDKYLFNERPKLTWIQRYRVLQGVASALLYLHEEWEQVVLHRDVKASNVLLDSDFNGRLGDFGLARLYDHGAIPQTTHIVGTLGYLAPELTRTGKATTRTDVFAFGAFMLEVACGRRPVEQQELPEKMILVDWVYECWRKGAILELSDPWLGDNYLVEQMELVLKLGLLCSHPVPEARPSMRQILHYLDGDASFSDLALEGFPDDSSNEKIGGDWFSSFAVSHSSTQPPSSDNSILLHGR